MKYRIALVAENGMLVDSHDVDIPDDVLELCVQQVLGHSNVLDGLVCFLRTASGIEDEDAKESQQHPEGCSCGAPDCPEWIKTLQGK